MKLPFPPRGAPRRCRWDLPFSLVGKRIGDFLVSQGLKHQMRPPALGVCFISNKCTSTHLHPFCFGFAGALCPASGLWLVARCWGGGYYIALKPLSRLA